MWAVRVTENVKNLETKSRLRPKRAVVILRGMVNRRLLYLMHTVPNLVYMRKPNISHYLIAICDVIESNVRAATKGAS